MNPWTESILSETDVTPWRPALRCALFAATGLIGIGVDWGVLLIVHAL